VYYRRVASIFDEIGTPPPANAPAGSAQLDDWAYRQAYLENLKSRLPSGTPLDLPESVLQAIADGGQTEQSVGGNWEQQVQAQTPYEQLIPPDPQAMADVNRFDELMGGMRLLHEMRGVSMHRGGAVGGALARGASNALLRRWRAGALSSLLG